MKKQLAFLSMTMSTIACHHPDAPSGFEADKAFLEQHEPRLVTAQYGARNCSCRLNTSCVG